MGAYWIYRTGRKDVYWIYSLTGWMGAYCIVHTGYIGQDGWGVYWINRGQEGLDHTGHLGQDLYIGYIEDKKDGEYT